MGIARKFVSMILVLAALSVFMPSVQAYTRRTVRVGFFQFSSFQEIDESGNFSGYGYDYLQEIAKYTGWKYEYVPGSWDDCLKMLENGEIDIVGSAQYTPERAEKFAYSKLSSGMSFAVLCVSGNNRVLAYEDFEGFDGMTVGIMEGNSRNGLLPGYCKSNGFEVHTRMYPDETTLIAALNEGQVDAILTSNLRKGRSERIVARFAPSPYYFISKKGEEGLISALNDAQAEIQVNTPHFATELYEKYYGVGVSDTPVFTKAERDFIAKQETIRVYYDPGAAPFESYNEKTGQFEGITADVFDLISDYSGLRFMYIPMGKDSGLSEFGGEQTSIVCISCINPEVVSGFYLSEPFLEAANVIVRNNHKPSNVRPVVARSEHGSQPDMPVTQSPRRIVYYPTVKDCFEAVRDGEATETYADTYTASYLMSQIGDPRVDLSALANSRTELMLAVSKGSDPMLTAVLNKSIKYIAGSQLDDFILENTSVSGKVTLGSLIHRYPVLSILTIAGTLLAVIGVLIYISWIQDCNRRRIETLLFIDPLTGGWNLNKFRTEADRLLLRGGSYALVNIDIERFKYLNDSLGRAQADELLKTLYQFMCSFVQEGELIAHVSGDQFVGLLHYTDKDSLQTRLKSFVNTLEMVLPKDGKTAKLVFSAGVYLPGPQEQDVLLLIDRANEARKLSKGTHHHVLTFYNEEVSGRIQAEQVIGSIMERALAEGQFVAYYQPKFDLASRVMIGAEALARWENPQRGLVPPIEFIPFFEKNGFIVELDFCIFEQVCRMLREWIDRGEQFFPISSNFSRVHLAQADFVSRLCKIADQYRIPHHLLELELTETAAEENTDSLIALSQRLSEMGFLLAMDDFGSGYSSLNLLKRLSVDTIKLDKDFLEKDFSCPKERTIIQGVVEIAHKLSIHIICEGVETDEQANFLQSVGCDSAQGYLLARPMPRTAFEELKQQDI